MSYAEWEYEGQLLIEKLQHQSLTFALGYAFGRWWANKPK